MNHDDEETVIRSVFDKFSKGRTIMSAAQFLKFLGALSKKVESLRGVELGQAKAAMALYAEEPDRGFTYPEFKGWWRSSDKYSSFIGEKAKLLRKAYHLYESHSSQKGGMKSEEFKDLLRTLNLRISSEELFDRIDKNDDGVVSFSEFCDWLRWF